jgi:RHS repeat-associated protein
VSWAGWVRTGGLNFLSAGTGSPQYAYGYDHASNLTSITPNGATESFSYTSTNTITGQTYDANGSPTVLSGNSYKWDGENRIVRFASSANNTGSSFTYDGLGRLVRIVDTHGGAITADHSYTLCGNVRCLAHDNTQSGSPVSTQYFAQGAIISGTSFYYVRDELGSVTQLVTSAGTVASQYTYDPYGNQTTVSGTTSDIGYAGYFTHAVSGLDFTLHRAYDPTHARWLNRDPIGESGGINLYQYTRGNPTSNTDPSGEFVPIITGGIGAGAAAIGNIIVQLHQTGDVSCINWKNVGVSALTGFVAGFAAPFVGLAGAVGVGAGTNLLNYWGTQTVNNDAFSPQAAVGSVETGALGGLVGGAFIPGVVFAQNSPWLSQTISASLNLEAGLALNVTTSNLLRSLTGNIVAGQNSLP